MGLTTGSAPVDDVPLFARRCTIMLYFWAGLFSVGNSINIDSLAEKLCEHGVQEAQARDGKEERRILTRTRVG